MLSHLTPFAEILNPFEVAMYLLTACWSYEHRGVAHQRAVPRAIRHMAVALASLGALLSTLVSQAATFGSLDRLTQPEFETLMTNLAAATHYKSIAPGETLGMLGADVAVELSATDAENELFDLAGGGAADLSDSLLIPRLHMHKGLPFRVDIGGVIGALADTDLTIVGAELRYAIIEGGIATPALALRASASRIQGSTDIDLDNAALELTLSKGILIATPYIGAGIVKSWGSAVDNDRFEDFSVEQEKIFVGVNLNLGLNMAVEVDVTGDYTTYSAKAGIRF